MKPRRKQYDPYLRLVPWRIDATFAPLERVLHRIEADGEVDVAGRQIVFREDMRGGWYDLLAALGGIIEFHQIAESRHGIGADLAPLIRLYTKLDKCAPLFETDLEAARRAIDSCKRAAQRLRASQAISIVDTVRISCELDKFRGAQIRA